MKKEYLLVVLVVIVVFTGIFFFSKKKLSIQSLSYYRGGGDSVSSYRIELSSNYLSICKTDDNTILLSSNYDLPDKAIKTTREILQLIHTYYDNNIE